MNEPTFTFTHPLHIFEQFCLIEHVWDVNHAKEILNDAPRDVERVNVEDWCDALDYIFVERCDVESGEDIDLDVPIIIAQTEMGNAFILDGYHRLARAQEIGQDTLPAVMLSIEENVLRER